MKTIEGRDKLVTAIRRITVDADNDKPNGPAEQAIEVLRMFIDPASWPKVPDPGTMRRVAMINEKFAELCSALADDTHELREAATAYFADDGIDFERPEIDHEAEALRAG